MRNIGWLALIAALSLPSFAVLQPQDAGGNASQGLVYRDPFKLKLHVDKKHFYEENFDKIPYVEEGNVHIFPGESFGIVMTVNGDDISAVTYQQDLRKSDMEFKFAQEMNGDKVMMILTTHNKLKRRLYFDAAMSFPDKKGMFKTNVLPIEPGLFSFESWPQPIVQLVLSNFRFAPKDTK